jgi:hypothetical protein
MFVIAAAVAEPFGPYVLFAPTQSLAARPHTALPHNRRVARAIDPPRSN